MFKHYSVMLNECIDNLKIKPDGTYVDCTAGGGGHSFEIARRLSESGRLIAIDKDIDAINECKNRLKQFQNCTLVHNDFHNYEQVLKDLNIEKVDGVLIDLGVSSFQIDTAERGFSYRFDAPLDMRMNKEQSLSAFEVVNTYSEEELTRIFFEYGEEKFSRKIAKAIVDYRKTQPIKTTLELVSVAESVLPAKVRFAQGHSCKRIFQAIRIEVNNEIDDLKDVLISMCNSLNSGGRMCVLTFHSLEDRIVKETFKDLNTDCICPKNLPVCVCNHKRACNLITRKPIVATPQELAENSRSQSAKLRVIEKV